MLHCASVALQANLANSTQVQPTVLTHVAALDEPHPPQPGPRADTPAGESQALENLRVVGDGAHDCILQTRSVRVHTCHYCSDGRVLVTSSRRPMGN